MPRTGEPTFNGYFAEALRSKHPQWRDHLGVEQTGVFPDAPRLRPDILVRVPDAQPVAVDRSTRLPPPSRMMPEPGSVKRR